jgi:uncharacterized protein YdhG (YjbR/CyaY superfamily)
MRSPIDIYLSNIPSEQRSVLQRLRKTIKSIVPNAEEVISTRVPAFKYKGKVFVSFGAWKTHLSLFIMRGSVMKLLKKDLKPYDTSRFVIRFSHENPLPASLVRKIVKARIAEINKQVQK